MRPLLLSNQPPKFENLAYWRIQYRQIEGAPAFKDFLHRINQIKLGMEVTLLSVDGLDKFGNDRNNELRASLHALNTILSYIPAMQLEYDKLENRLSKQQESKKPGSGWKV